MDKTIPGHWFCTLHGPISGPGCPKCQDTLKPGRMLTDRESAAFTKALYKEKPMTQPTPEHTSLPWMTNVTRKNERTIEIDITDGRVKICAVVGSIDPLVDSIAGAGQAHGNARLIVKSVNSHHRLTSALKNLLQTATPEHIEEAADALEAAGVVPILPGHCPECGEMPCGQYMGCPAESEPWSEETHWIGEPATGETEVEAPVPGRRPTPIDLARWTPKPHPTDTKPDSQEWVDGLPPAGAECEYQPDPYHKDIWHRCTFLAHMDGEFFVLCSEDSEVDRMNDSFPASRRFRPLKTQAEREREEAETEACKAVYARVGDDNLVRTIKATVAALYDAGLLRKGGE